MSKSSYLRDALLNHHLGGPAYTRPVTVYASLHTGVTGLSGDSECTGNNYARVAVTNNSTSFPAASAGAKTNGVAIQFPIATALSSGWGDVTDVGLWDAPSGGNFLRGGTLTNGPITVQGGDAPYIAAGDITFSEA